MSSSIPTPVPLSSQVGGHAGVLEAEDGSVIFKPVLPLELEFYQARAAEKQREEEEEEPLGEKEKDEKDPFWRLRPFLPVFFGTLNLEGKVDENITDTLAIKPLDDSKDHQKDE